MRPLNFVLGILVGTVFSSALVIAWTGPTSAPPSGNVSAPINVGNVMQEKQGIFGAYGILNTGSFTLLGSNRYISFDSTPDSSGYGIRDNAGTMEVKNSGGAWAPIASSTLPTCPVGDSVYSTGTGWDCSSAHQFGTFDPAASSNYTISNGNLELVRSSAVNAYGAFGTFWMSSGKWYWEAQIVTVGATGYLGVARSTVVPGTTSIAPAPANAWAWARGAYTLNGTATAGPLFTTGDTIMYAYDADAGKLWFGVNGTWNASGNPATGLNPIASSVTPPVRVAVGASNNTGAHHYIFNFGQGEQPGVTYYSSAGGSYIYQPPTGFKALSSGNL